MKLWRNMNSMFISTLGNKQFACDSGLYFSKVLRFGAVKQMIYYKNKT